MPKVKRCPYAYHKRKGSRLRSADVQEVGELIADLAKTHGTSFDSVPPLELVRASRTSRGAVLKRYIEWNNQKAADAFRIEQARRIILSIEVVYIDKARNEIRSPAFVGVQDPLRPRQITYSPADVVWSRKNLSDQVVTRAKRTLEAWIREYENVKFLSGAVRAAKIALKCCKTSRSKSK
jgi:hypothetical protein